MEIGKKMVINISIRRTQAITDRREGGKEENFINHEAIHVNRPNPHLSFINK